MTPKAERSRWSELPKWAWAQGLRKNVHFRAEGVETYDEAAANLPEVAANIDEAQVIISKIEYHDRNPDLGQHRPILDIDFPAQLVPSSTEGHFHLYLDKPMPWSDYAKLLRVLAEVGIIEPGYGRASEARKYTAVRLPWVRKEDAPDDEPPADQPEVELVDRVADEALATLPPRPNGRSTTACNCFGAEDGFHNDGCSATTRRSPIQAPEQNNMREPLTNDTSTLSWRSPHRAISYSRLLEINPDYMNLLEANPTTGNALWRNACRTEQQRQNRERVERAERQEARVRREHEERERMLAQDRAERQAQAAPRTWSDELRRAYPTAPIANYNLADPWLRPRQAPFELISSEHDRIIRDNRGRQLTEEDLYNAQHALRMSPSDLNGPRMEEMWERCYEYTMSRRQPRPRDVAVFSPGTEASPYGHTTIVGQEDRPRLRINTAPILENLRAALAPQQEAMIASLAEEQRVRDALRIANGETRTTPSQAPSLAESSEQAAE